jgi:hypothetical protein
VHGTKSSPSIEVFARIELPRVNPMLMGPCFLSASEFAFPCVRPHIQQTGCSCWRIRARARKTRDLTVAMGIPMVLATSR